MLSAKVTPCMENGKVAIARGLKNGIGFGSTEFHVTRPGPGLAPEYVFFYLIQQTVRSDAKRSMGGAVGLLRVPASFLAELDMPLPPSSEQRRIVAKIEELFSQLDAGVEELKKAKAQLKRYRQAVLKAAFEGKLTEEWRKAHKGKVEPASVLLERIKDERKLKLGRRYTEPAPLDAADLPALPNEWVWVTLGQLVWSVRDGPHYSPKYTTEGIPFITGGNIRPSGVDFAGAKRISPETHLELCRRCRPEKGDVLYTKGGTTGIARVNTYDREFSVWVHVAVLKLLDGVEAFFVQHALNSPLCYAQAQSYTHGVGNQDLGLTRMVNIVLGLPPLAEQRQVIAEVEQRLSVIDAEEKAIEAALKQAARLRQSILKRAFDGRLVPQDPTDEPADRLLERIRAEKAKQAAGQPRGRGRRTATAGK